MITKENNSLSICDVRSTLQKMDNIFDTHKFIDQFKIDFQEKYERFVKGYKTIEAGNAQIGKFLSKFREDLHIKSLGRTTSINMYGGKTGCEKWGKL